MEGAVNIVEVIPGAVLGLREGLEAFLIIGMMVRYLEKSGRGELTVAVRIGLGVGAAGSVLIGLGLFGLARLLGEAGESVGDVWESVASLAGLALLTTFIYWMMKHGKTIGGEVKAQVDSNLSRWGIGVLATVVVLREGSEIALFGFSASQPSGYMAAVAVGLLVAALLAFLIYRSLIRVNLGVLFSVTLAYLVLQAGYLLGYSIHELLSALHDTGTIGTGSVLLARAFDFQGTILDHKSGVIGVALNILLGWYSRPEWIPFAAHYLYVVALFVAWRRVQQRERRRALEREVRGEAASAAAPESSAAASSV
jgi:high-affinity iron transporter